MARKKLTPEELEQEIARRREIHKQVEAINRFEMPPGFVPDPEYLALVERWINCEISAEELKALILARWKRA